MGLSNNPLSLEPVCEGEMEISIFVVLWEIWIRFENLCLQLCLVHEKMEDEKIVQRFCDSREERKGKKDEKDEEWIDVKERETFLFIKITCWEAL